VEWFASESDQKEHSGFHNPDRDSKMLYCQLCDYSIKSKTFGENSSSLRSFNIKGNTKMKEHLARHSKYPCPDCDKIYSGKYRLNKHIKSSHSGVQNCDICGLQYLNQDSLKAHIRNVHHSEYNFPCDECDKKCTSYSGLKKHKISAHGKCFLGITCDKCGKKIKNSTRLKEHIIRKHTSIEDRPFGCEWDNCGKRFGMNWELATHERIHTKEKPFKCGQCDSTFRRAGHLSKHTKVHTGERSHVCSVCGKGFIQRCNLKVHQSKCV
jgi:KRAB domain-containing zinc finger protein